MQCGGDRFDPGRVQKFIIAITSSAFINGDRIPDIYDCNGANVNPPLAIYNLPEQAMSWALIVDDPDSSSGHFTHWLIFNIAPTEKSVAEDSAPYGAKQDRTDFGQESYGGPCPSYGTHHYHFRVFALDKKLELSSGATRAQVGERDDGSHFGSRRISRHLCEKIKLSFKKYPIIGAVPKLRFW